MSATFLGDLKAKAVGGMSICQTISNTTNNDIGGTGVDFLTAEGPVTAMLQMGNVTGTGAVDIDVKIQSSTDNSGWADVTNGTFTQSYNQTTADNVLEFLMIPSRDKRYLRAHASVTGTTVTTAAIAVSLFSNKKISGSGVGSQTT